MSLQINTLSASLQTRVRKLARKKYRTEFGEFILEGVRLVADALQWQPGSLRFVVLEETKLEAFASMIADCKRNSIPVYMLTEKDFTALADTEHTQGIMALAAMPEALSPMEILPKNKVVTVLHEASDPGNLGTIIRSCDWFGAPAILLSPGSADPWNPKAVRGSMGSILRAQIGSFKDYDELLQLAAVNGFTVFAADAGASISLYDCSFNDKSMLLFGSEAHGLPDDLTQHVNNRFSIPKSGSAESLNLAIAHAAVMTELQRQRL